MAMGSSSGRGGVKNDINVTPLVDVVLVLLIIFMVITPMLTRGKDVALPKAKVNQQDEPPKDPLVVTVTPDGKIWIETDEAPGNLLESRIGQMVREAPTRPLLLKGDREMTVGKIREVMGRLKKAGAKSIDLAVEDNKGGSS
jgi:biopolymer transport protein TolR